MIATALGCLLKYYCWFFNDDSYQYLDDDFDHFRSSHDTSYV